MGIFSRHTKRPIPIAFMGIKESVIMMLWKFSQCSQIYF